MTYRIDDKARRYLRAFCGNLPVIFPNFMGIFLGGSFGKNHLFLTDVFVVFFFGNKTACNSLFS
jgi:hypothetical protein